MEETDPAFEGPADDGIHAMKSFFCGDVVPGCDATFRADTDAAILGQVSRHARDDHGLAVVPSALADQVLLAIR